MRSLKFVSSLSIALGLLVSIVGCGGSSGDGYTGERGNVSGTVTLDDQPLPKGCQVLFIAEKGGYTAGGVIEDGGKYSLVYGGGKGLPVGDYAVQLSPPLVAEGAAPPVDPMQMAGKLSRKSGNEVEESGPFPTRYSSTSSSGLKFTIAAGDNTIDVKLVKSEKK